MLKMETEKYKHILLKALAIILVTVTVLAILKLSFFLLTPFIIAMLLSFLMEPLVKKFQSLKIPRGFSVSLSMIIFFGTIITLVSMAMVRIIVELTKLYANIPEYSEKSLLVLNELFQRGKDLIFQLPPELFVPVQNAVESLTVKVGLFLTEFAKNVLDILTFLPGMLIFILITIVATFFMTKDKVFIRDFIFRQLPPIWADKLRSLKTSLFGSILGFLKAQSILLTLTFTESFIGLSIINIDYALIIALCIALIDILPILGTGTILVPWSLVNFAFGDVRMGVSLLVLWGIIICVRYMVEPKIMGASLGIHPLVALMAMFIGLKLFGVAGVLLGPAAIIFVKALMNAGIVPKFK